MNHELIKHLRMLSGLSQNDLAEKLGVHQTLISKIEAGERLIQIETERKLLEVFAEAGISEADIYLLKGLFESRKMKPVKKDWKGL